MKRLLITASFFLLAIGFFVTPASAQTVGLTGFAWSDLPSTNTEVGAGWISFSGPGPYGVVANTSTGNLSGYAWSSNYGWLSFNLADVSGCPSGTCQPNINPSTGLVTGWARFIAAPAGTTDIWNGWVHLNSGSVPLTYNSGTQTFSGYAWGQNDIGWVRWGGPGYTVTMSPLIPPEATINIVTVPANATWTINPGAIGGTGSGTATVTPSQVGTSYTVTGGSAPSGYDFPPTITNSQGGGSSALILPGTSITFTITYTQSFNYALSNNGNISVQKAGISQPGQNVITATQSAGAGQSVTLSHSNLPAGVTSGGFSGQGCTPSAGNPCNFTGTLNVAPSAVSGTYTGIIVTGLPLGRTTTFNLTIIDSPNIILSCTANPASAQVGQDVTWTVDFTNNPNPQPPYTYSWSGSGVAVPPNDPRTQSFIISYSTTGVKTVQATVVDSLLNSAQCNGSLNIGAKPDFGEF